MKTLAATLLLLCVYCYAKPQALIPIENELELWGLANEEGVEVVPPRYSSLKADLDYYRVTKDGKAGLLGPNGQVVAPCEYEEAFVSQINEFEERVTFENGDLRYAIVRKYMDWSLLSGAINLSSLQMEIPVAYDAVDVSGAGIWVQQGDKWGLYRDSLSNFKYDSYSRIYSHRKKPLSYIAVRQGNKTGVVDKNDSLRFAIDYDGVRLFYYNLFMLRKNGEWLLQDISKPNQVLLKADHIEFMYKYKLPAYAKAHKGELWGVINLRGKCSGFKYQNIMDDAYLLAPVQQDGKWGYVNVDLAEEVVACEYSDAGIHSPYAPCNGEPLAAVKQGDLAYYLDTIGRPFFLDIKIEKHQGKYALVGPNGKLLTGPAYNKIREQEGGCPFYIAEQNGLKGIINNRGDVLLPFDYNELVVTEGFQGATMLKMSKNKKQGLVTSKDFKISVQAEYDELQIFDSPLEPFGVLAYPVKQGGKWGLLNLKGEPILPVEFDELSAIFSQKEPYFLLGKKAGLWGIYNANGQMLTAPAFDKVYDETGGLLRVERDKKMGCLDLDGKILAPCAYDNVGDRHNDRIDVYKDKRWGEIDLEGKEYFDE